MSMVSINGVHCGTVRSVTVFCSAFLTRESLYLRIQLSPVWESYAFEGSSIHPIYMGICLTDPCKRHLSSDKIHKA